MRLQEVLQLCIHLYTTIVFGRWWTVLRNNGFQSYQFLPPKEQFISLILWAKQYVRLYDLGEFDVSENDQLTIQRTIPDPFTVCPL